PRRLGGGRVRQARRPCRGSQALVTRSAGRPRPHSQVAASPGPLDTELGLSGSRVRLVPSPGTRWWALREASYRGKSARSDATDVSAVAPCSLDRSPGDALISA